MKLSQAIEDALLTRKYNSYDEFMCTVLKNNYSLELRNQLQEMLNVIFPGILSRPLVNQLFERAGGLEMSQEDNNVFWANSFQLTAEWYVWFVFDLKRKGL